MVLGTVNWHNPCNLCDYLNLFACFEQYPCLDNSRINFYALIITRIRDGLLVRSRNVVTAARKYE